jgi:hypothetical protein
LGAAPSPTKLSFDLHQSDTVLIVQSGALL